MDRVLENLKKKLGFSSDKDLVLENLKKALAKLDGHLEKCSPIHGYPWGRLPFIVDDWKSAIRKLYNQLLRVRSSYHKLIVSWILENMPEYQQLWGELMTETFKSLEMSLGYCQGELSLADVASHHKAGSTILRILICYKMSSSFRLCFNRKSFSAKRMKIWLGMLRQAVEPFTLYESEFVQRHFKFTNSREILFMESVIHSLNDDVVLKMKDEIPSDLLADIDVVLSKASGAIVNRLASGSHNSIPVNTAVRFISMMIYSQVRVIEETAAPSQYQKGGPVRSFVQSLSRIDEIELEFWDSILMSMLEILNPGSCQCIQRMEINEPLPTQLRCIMYFLTGPPMGFSSKLHWNNFSHMIKVTIIKQVTNLFLSCYCGNINDTFREQVKNVVGENIRLIYTFERENFSHCPSTHYDLESLRHLSATLSRMTNFLRKRSIEKAQGELTFLIDSLSKISNERIEYDELNSLCSQIMNVACAMHFIGHSLLAGRCPNLYLNLWFSDFEKDTKLMRQKIDSISEKNKSTNQDHDVTTLSNYKLPNGTDPIINEEIVGFVDEEIKVVEHIVRGSEDMAVVLIAGMAGLGKTTLAKKVFNNHTVAEHFYVRSPILMWDIIDLPDAIGLLVRLRFLAGPFSSIPSSIGKLTNLVTFHMVVLQTDVIEIPSSFYSLVRLRHLHISCASIFNPHHFKVSDPVPPFYSLQTLSTLLLPECGGSVLTLFPSLRKLKCLFVNRHQRVTYPQFDLLTQLESLEMTYLLGDWDETVPRCNVNWNFSFPPSIRKLTLKMFCLPWNEMSIIDKLPNLEVLKLDRSAFVGKEWNVEDGVFLKLKYLRLRGLNIIRWNASADNFPRLENLVVQGCKYLEEIPADFANIPTLKAIEVSGCKLSVEASAKEIYEEQAEYGNEELKILARDNGPNKAYIWSGTVRRKLASELL